MTELLLWVARNPFDPSMVGSIIAVDDRPALVVKAGLRSLEVRYLPRRGAFGRFLRMLKIR